MENIGDWLYIILIGVAGVISVINSGKKKKAEEEAKKMQPPRDIVTPETASDRSFWEIILNPEEEAQPKPQPVRTKKTAQPSPKTKTSPTRTGQPFLTGETEIERMIRLQGENDSPIFAEEIYTPLVTSEEFHEPDALRKAVIYAEILNRKY
ncbi:hypothetical protein LJB97_01450 [Parabacteroides sp. OttesenSCG-928-O15]|nr:hypothetical protein [Parabacteroides sp. OttesenSCG-928-O15]